MTTDIPEEMKAKRKKARKKFFNWIKRALNFIAEKIGKLGG